MDDGDSDDGAVGNDRAHRLQFRRWKVKVLAAARDLKREISEVQKLEKDDAVNYLGLLKESAQHSKYWGYVLDVAAGITWGFTLASVYASFAVQNKVFEDADNSILMGVAGLVTFTRACCEWRSKVWTAQIRKAEENLEDVIKRYQTNQV
ncbi:hypothetical protein HY485_01645 [Candidatus Woesearchaeota archaeon]|nr:hypothetical protein [Candidatus Woesearchaeota archaeon]